MQKTLSAIVIIVLTYLFFSCEQQGESSQSLYLYDLKVSETLKIPIDSTTNFQSLYLDYYQDPTTQKKYLAYLSVTDSDIHFYDLERKNLGFKIETQDDGPEKVNSIDAFLIKNLDSVYMVSAVSNIASLINQRGKLLKTYNLNFSPLHVFVWVDNYKRLAFLTSNKLIIHKAPFLYTNKPGIWDYNIGFAYHTDVDSVRVDSIFKYTGLPSQKIHGGAHTRFGFTADDRGNYIYSFCMDDTLYITDFQGDTQKYQAKSKYVGEIPAMKENASNDEVRIFYMTQYAYRHIIYDSFRKVYYRFVLHPTDETSKDFDHGKPFSVIILNENFKKVGETQIFKEKYAYTNFFVAPEGLYISKNHPENPEADEDYLSFDLFKLVKNE